MPETIMLRSGELDAGHDQRRFGIWCHLALPVHLHHLKSEWGGGPGPLLGLLLHSLADFLRQIFNLIQRHQNLDAMHEPLAAVTLW